MTKIAHVEKVSFIYGVSVVAVLIFAFASLFGMFYFSVYFSNPSEMQKSTFEFCKTVSTAAWSGFAGLILGKVS